MQHAKRKKEELKQINTSLKTLQEEITELLMLQNMSSCTAFGHMIELKERVKKPTVTTKKVTEKMKSYFKIPDEQFLSFHELMEEERKSEVVVAHCLECKPMKTQQALALPMDPQDKVSSDSALTTLYT